ncbi:MAG: OsmC family protein [Candidatus Omnitrophota bacterium]
MYRVDISNENGYNFKVRSDGYEFTIDAREGAITPPATLLAGLGSCVGVYLRKYAESAKLALGAFNVSVEAQLSKDAPFRFSRINVSVDLKGQEFDERRQKAMLEFVKNCPVHNTLKNDPVVEIKIA